MKRAIPLLVAGVFLAACEDKPSNPNAAPTAPVAAPIQASASTEFVVPSGASTICRVYATERSVAKTELDAATADTALQRRVKVLDALVKETCN